MRPINPSYCAESFEAEPAQFLLKLGQPLRRPCFVAHCQCLFGGLKFYHLTELLALKRHLTKCLKMQLALQKSDKVEQCQTITQS